MANKGQGCVVGCWCQVSHRSASIHCLRAATRRKYDTTDERRVCSVTTRAYQEDAARGRRKRPVQPQRQQVVASDPELRAVLELASDRELEEIYECLHGMSFENFEYEERERCSGSSILFMRYVANV